MLAGLRTSGLVMICLGALALTGCGSSSPGSSSPVSDLTPSGTTLAQGQPATVVYPTTDKPPQTSKLQVTVLDAARYYTLGGPPPQDWPYCLNLKVTNVGTGPSNTDGFSQSMKLYTKDGTELGLFPATAPSLNICENDVDPGSPDPGKSDETDNLYGSIVIPGPPAKAVYQNGSTRITWTLNSS